MAAPRSTPSSGRPRLETVPEVGGTRPIMTRSRVDLPQPDGPAMHTNCRSGISSETFSSTGTTRPRSFRDTETCRSSNTSSLQHVPALDVAVEPIPHHPVERHDGHDQQR